MWWNRCSLLLMAGVALAQIPAPQFTREGIAPFQSDRPRMLAPGMIVELYGEHLGPNPVCDAPASQNGRYPTEACGVRVTVGGRAAGLLFVSEKQINLKIPADAPDEGVAPFQICVHEVCSQQVEVRFSTHKAYIKVQGTAYVRMPVWIEADQPMPYDIAYPKTVWPWQFGGYAFEVRRNGQPLAPIRPQPTDGGLFSGGTVAPQDAPRSRLPLHLFYSFDQPGTYSVQFTGWRFGPDGRTPQIASQSDWTDIVVHAISEAQRDAWLQAEAARIQSATPGQLVGDIIPSLLAFPNEKALLVLAPLLLHPDNLVRQFARCSLAAFDDAVVRRVIPASELRACRIVMG